MRTRIEVGTAVLKCLAVLLLVIPACADEPGSDLLEQRSRAVTVSELKGAAIATGQGQYNRCVRNVSAAFASLPLSPSNRAAYLSKGGQRLPPYNATLLPFIPLNFSPDPISVDLGVFGTLHVPFSATVPHIQSLTRFEFGDQLDDRWFAVSRSFELGPTTGLAGFFLVHLPDMEGADGGRLLNPSVNYLSPIPPGRATQYYYPAAGTVHPGGMQAFGHYLAVAAESPTGASFVDFYDFSGGYGAGSLIQRVNLFWNAPGLQPDRSITGVAITRLKDGRYLMFVLGKDSAHRGWFFVSRDPSLPSAWDPYDYFDGNADTTGFGAYQNVSFVTDCATQDIFMFGTGNSGFQYVLGPGTDYLDLFRLDPDPLVGVRMTSAGRRTFTPNSWDTCSFRAGATLYAGKDNRLMLYCHAYTSANALIAGNGGLALNSASTLKFVEYNHQGCLYSEFACGASCCNQGDSCQSGVCCAAGDVCGSTCCGVPNTCANQSLSLCCAPYTTPCGGNCCTLDQACVAGACQPLPPPPPPPPPGTCPGPFPSCSVPNDCPSTATLCEDGCCRPLG